MFEQRSPEWHEQRAGKLTASRVAAALGVDPYTSRPKLWRILTGAEPEPPATQRMADGILAEPFALRDYEIATGRLVEEVGWVPHPRIAWLGASPDGLVDDGLVEIKCPDPDHWKRHDFVPPHYNVQIQAQLECTDREWCDYWQWNQRTGESLLIHVLREREWWTTWALPRLEEFWGYVERKELPPRMKRQKETA